MKHVVAPSTHENTIQKHSIASIQMLFIIYFDGNTFQDFLTQCTNSIVIRSVNNTLTLSLQEKMAV